MADQLLSAGFVSQCRKPVGSIKYADGKGYTDFQMIPHGRTAAEMIGVRFAHCGGRLPEGWTARVEVYNPEPKEWAELWAELDANHRAGLTRWVLTTKAQYWAMLEAVPPARQVNGGFLCGEAWSHTEAGEPVYRGFTCRAGVYEACNLTVAQFRKLVG